MFGGSEKTKRAPRAKRVLCAERVAKIRLGGLRERRKLPQWGPGQSPGRQKLLPHFSSKTVLMCFYFSYLQHYIYIHIIQGSQNLNRYMFIYLFITNYDSRFIYFFVMKLRFIYR